MAKVIISEERTKNPMTFSKPVDQLTDEELLSELMAFAPFRGKKADAKPRSGVTAKKTKEAVAAKTTNSHAEF